jgi:NADH-quinone oxidoreductase subunit G
LPELGTIGRGESSTISTFVEKTVDHELSGNMIDICPVGALNNKPYRYTDRTWELDQIESVSPHDCVGSNMFLHVKGDKIKRIVPKANPEINEVWISDRDRFAFDGIYSDDRLTVPMLRKNGVMEEATWEEAIDAFSKVLITLQNKKSKNGVAALISSSTALHEQYLYAYLMRSLGFNNIDHRIRQIDFTGDSLDPIFPNFDIKPHQIENMKSILIIGSDLRKETPLIAHWVKKAADQGASVNFINQEYSEYYFPIDNFILSGQEALAENLALVLKASNDDAVNKLPSHIEDVLNALPTPSLSHYQIAKSLANHEQSFLLSGLHCHSHSEYALIRSYLNLLSYVSNSSFGELTHGANATGAYLTGCIPHRKAFGESHELGLNALEMCTKNHQLIVLYGIEPEDCLYQEKLNQSIVGSQTTVQFSPFITPFMKENADIMFPLKTPYESKGVFINASGMIQDFNLQLDLAKDNPSNQELLLQIIEGSKLPMPSLDNLKEKVKKFIDETKNTHNRLLEIPEKVLKTTKNYSSVSSHLYDVDSITRRSRPLQQTKDALSQFSEDQ